MKSNNYVYCICDPYGNKYENIISLQEFCNEYNSQVLEDSQKLSYDCMRKACKSGKLYKKWSIVRTTKNNKESNNKIEIKGLTIEEKVVKLSDENNKLKSQLRENLRSSSLFKELADVISNIPAYNYIPELKINKQEGKIVESAVLVLSDLHSDQTIKAERVNNLEEYNFNAFCHRADNVVKTTIKHLTQNLQGYSFKTLYIFSLGDNVAGLIHNSQQHTEWQNVLKSSVACGSVIAKMIVDLSAYFNKIVYVGISGNHPRLDVGKKDYRGSQLNFDYLVNITAKSKCKELIDLNRVDFVIPDSWSTLLKIYDYNFHLSHGDTLTGCSLGIPFYGLQRRSYRLTSLGAVDGIIPHYQIIGHYHSQSSISEPVGKLIVNGAFPSCDEYSYHELTAYHEPSQLLFGVHPSHGMSWSMPIQIRNKNWRSEEKKISRYNSDLF